MQKNRKETAETIMLKTDTIITQTTNSVEKEEQKDREQETLVKKNGGVVFGRGK